MAIHRHRAPKGWVETRPWVYCVADGPCDGRAHGAVVRVELCRCGAVRRTEVNGRFKASSGWSAPTIEEVRP